MNLSTVITNLKNTIAGKEEYLAKWKNIDPIETSERIHRATIVGMLEINIEELKRILQDVEQCLPDEFANMRNEASWITNPDRSGGQFTQDEIDNAGRW